MSQIHLIPRFKKFVMTGLALLMLAAITLLPARPIQADPLDPIPPTPAVPVGTDGWTDPVGG